MREAALWIVITLVASTSGYFSGLMLRDQGWVLERRPRSEAPVETAAPPSPLAQKTTDSDLMPSSQDFSLSTEADSSTEVAQTSPDLHLKTPNKAEDQAQVEALVRVDCPFPVQEVLVVVSGDWAFADAAGTDTAISMLARRKAEGDWVIIEKGDPMDWDDYLSAMTKDEKRAFEEWKGSHY